MTLFQDFFFRPNMSSNGTVPAQSPFYTSPDIICGQTSPIQNFTAILRDNYEFNAYNSNVMIGYENYLYLRGKNLAAGPVNRQVSLYYSPSSLISWPDQWVNNILSTDKGSTISLLTNVQPGAVAVAPDTFLWKPAAPTGSDHYCLFSYSTDPSHPQPIPGSDGMTSEDMADLIRNNLNIGWRNTVAITNQPPTWTHNHTLAVLPSVTSAETVAITLTCNKMVGCAVAFQGSNYEGADRPIKMDKTTVTYDGQILGEKVVLQPGFQCIITVDFWSNGVVVPSGGGVELGIDFDVGAKTSTNARMRTAAMRNLIDADRARAFSTRSNVDVALPVFLGAVNHIYT